MKLLVWNIQQGGGKRRHRVSESIIAHRPDIVALVEFVSKTAGELLGALRDAGFTHQLCTAQNGFHHAVCVLSKVPIGSRSCGIPVLNDSGLWLEITVPSHGFEFAVVHVPTRSRTGMNAFLSAVGDAAGRYVGDQFLVVGDFNTGVGPADGPLRNFGDVDRFIAIQKAGFTDLWRRFHGERIEHTWSRNGNSYRIDHALASPDLLPRVQTCLYSHEERIGGISDHSILIVEIKT